MSVAHISQEFDQELRALKDRLLVMGGRCERMILMAARAFEERDAALAKEVMRSDRGVNADELAVDEMAFRILALRQPVGRDLRFTLTAVKVVTDLERIGDEAVNLAGRAEELARANDIPTPALELPHMARLANAMLHKALDAFVREDADEARQVFLEDDEVDEIYGRILQGCAEFMKANSAQVDDGIRLASSAKYLERIADHATNIAEMVVFLVRGVDVRHPGNT